jgi:AcrR family transcriptional regulator
VGFADDECMCGGDGRTRRRLRNRRSIIDALGELIEQGVVDPSLDDLATQAGVSTRSVYRHFGTIDEAWHEWASETLRFVDEILTSASGPVLDGAPLSERCISLVLARLATYDLAGPRVLNACALRTFSSRASHSYESARRLIEEQVPERFAPELARMSDEERVVRLAIVNTMMSDLCIGDLMTRYADRRQQLVPLLATQIATALTV